MNTNSNTYTIIYSTVMVVIVAAVLAYVSVSLSGKQQANVNTETRQSILSSVNLGIRGTGVQQIHHRLLSGRCTGQ